MPPADHDLNEVFARNLRRLRTKSQESQEDFAAKCGLHRTYIGAIERGERNVTLKTVGLVAASLGVPTIELLRARK